MSKKKNKISSNDTNGSEVKNSLVDLSSLMDAAKTSFLDFSDEAKNEPLGAEKAEVFDFEEIEELKNNLELISKESEVHSEASQSPSLMEPASSKPLESEWDPVFEDIFNVMEGNKSFLDEDEQNSSATDAHQNKEEIREATLLESNSEKSDEETHSEVNSAIEGSELEGFDSASIEEIEFVEDTQLESIVESILFATDRPVSLPTLKQIFKGTNVTHVRIKKVIETLQVEYAGGQRGVTLEEVGSGYQLRTKVDNMEFLRRSFKAKTFKLSGPALEVLAITAYKQPVIKAEIDEIRGVESGHLLRALMEKNLVLFAGKSDLPGKPMQYGTTRKFLEIFGLRNLKELPTLSQIDELLPEGIGDEIEKPKLADISGGLAEKIGMSYSEGEEELSKITSQLENIDTSSEFFEKEKLRQKEQRDAEKAKNLREALAVGESVSTRDLNWLKRYDEQIIQASTISEDQAQQAINDLSHSSSSNFAHSTNGSESSNQSSEDESDELALALKEWDDDLEVGNDIVHRIEDNDLADIDEDI